MELIYYLIVTSIFYPFDLAAIGVLAQEFGDRFIFNEAGTVSDLT